MGVRQTQPHTAMLASKVTTIAFLFAFVVQVAEGKRKGVSTGGELVRVSDPGLQAVEKYIKARMPETGAQKPPSEENLNTILSTLDFENGVSISIEYPRKEGPYKSKDEIKKFLTTAPKSTVNVLGNPSVKKEGDGYVATWQMQLEGGWALGLIVKGMGIPWKTPMNLKATFEINSDTNKIKSIKVVQA